MDQNRHQHLELGRRSDFPFACDPRLFSDEQYATIRRWGHWCQGLSNGTLTPFTEAQQRFVAAVKGATPPEEPHAAAWWRYLKRRAIEEKHSAAMRSSHQVDADTFYNRDMAKQLRRTMGGVNLREHKRG
ncbi:MAG TPA: DUF413 domain-containing protein [Flavobacteriales bacterium]|nr:DUF413 domain-containing protein [Flavobacteriales bacterium]